MKAVIKTKSNYMNLNGQALPVVELAGRRVSCKVWSEEFGKYLTVDFALSEVVEFKKNWQA